MNSDEIKSLQTYKGFFYVFFTSILLYFLVLRFLNAQFKEYALHLQTLKSKSELEQSLQKTHLMYHNLFDNMLDSAAHCRMIYEDGIPIDYEYLNVNKIFESMTGLHNVIGRRISELIPLYAQENPDSLHVFGEVASTGKARKWEHYLKALDQCYSLSIYSPAQNEFIVIASDITEHIKHEKTLLAAKERFDKLAHHDTLTGLPNRLSLIEILETKTAKNDLPPFSLLFFDLDGFQDINDSYGHRFGDNLLIEVARLLQHTFFADTHIIRTGGDEFVVVVTRQEEQKALLPILNNFIHTLSHPFHIDGIDVYTTASIGIAQFPQDALTTESLLQCADAAMYKSKKSGKNTFHFYSNDLIENALQRTTISSNIKKALLHGELSLYYQPQVDPSNGDIIGFEALLRWETADGFIPPSVFIPICEESGTIIEIGEFVLFEGCKTAAKWSREGLLHGHIAINVSARQLIHPNFISTLERIIDQTQCQPYTIELEITESSILENPEKVIALLGVIKSKGFTISIDDFGTGYSSLSYLKNLPIDKLKIDISFIRNITHEIKNQTIVRTIISLAKGLGMNVLAEGVETAEEMNFLRENGIDSIQGYYYYHPMSEEDVTNFFQS